MEKTVYYEIYCRLKFIDSRINISIIPGMLSHFTIKRTVTVLMLLYCLLVPVFTACVRVAAEENRPAAVKGVIDLGAWDFEKYGSIDLDGEWEFYPGLLKPGDSGNPENMAVRSFIKVPGMWKDLYAGGKAVPLKGEATYRLEIINNTGEKVKTLTLYRIYSGFRVWINGVMACEKGMPDAQSDGEKNYVYVHSKSIIPFTPVKGINEIVVQVVNYDYKSGGIGRPPELQNEASMQSNRSIKHTVEMIIAGMVLFFSMASLLLYLFRRDDIAALYSGLFSLITAINVFNLNIPILSGPLYWPRNPYLVNFETVIFVVLFSQMSIKEIFPDEFSTYILRISQAILVPLSIVILFMDFRTSEKIMQVFFILTAFFLTYGMYVLAKAVFKRRDDAVLFFIGFTAAFAGGINDILYATWILKTSNISHYGTTVLCITLTLIVARRLSRTLQRLSKDLIEKNISLKKLDRLKDQFLANTSHELRTPLHGMIGLSESILAGSAGELPEGTRENLSLIVSSGHRLADMVNDLLDMAKIQDKGLNLNISRVDLYGLSSMVVKLSLPLTGDKPVEIINNIPPDVPAVRADENRIRQILHNLIGNAIKFTLKGRIEISAREITPADDGNDTCFVEVSVSDTGIGVPEEYRDGIFEAYTQVDTGDVHSYSGTGLGLAIAKQIVELHGGTISAAPGKECGSVFTFTLPAAGDMVEDETQGIIIESMNDLAIENLDRRAAFHAHAPGNELFEGNPVVLVVDDDPVNVRVLKNSLESVNCIVKTASDGISAIEIIENNRNIDLVLLDIMMPVMSGYEVCRRIRLKNRPEDMPVIILTAKNMMSDIDAAFEAGANDYIVKPFRMSELLARSAAILKLKNVRKSAAGGISIHNRGTTYSFTFGDIIYITSSAKNVIVHTVEGDTELPVMMKDMTDRLPPDMFVRIHKSHIINTGYIRTIDHVISGRYRVRLSDEDDTELPVGPVFLESLRKKVYK